MYLLVYDTVANSKDIAGSFSHLHHDCVQQMLSADWHFCGTDCDWKRKPLLQTKSTLVGDCTQIQNLFTKETNLNVELILYSSLVHPSWCMMILEPSLATRLLSVTLSLYALGDIWFQLGVIQFPISSFSLLPINKKKFNLGAQSRAWHTFSLSPDQARLLSGIKAGSISLILYLIVCSD